MLEINASIFSSGLKSVGAILWTSQFSQQHGIEFQYQEADWKPEIAKLEQLNAQLTAAGLRLSAASVNKMLALLRGMKLDNTFVARYRLPPIETQYLAHASKEAIGRIQGELETHLFLDLSEADTGLFSLGSLAFGEDVAKRFPNYSYDIDEAAKCLSLSRSTACVFHLMRVFERGIHSIADNLGVVLRDSDGWLNHLQNKLSPAIEALPDGTAPEKQRKKQLQQAKSHLHGIRQGWRNDTAHPKETYTDEEAKDLFGLTRTFVKHLAEIL